MRLLAGPYMVLITGREHVATLRGEPVWAVTATTILPLFNAAAINSAKLSAEERRDEGRYLRLLAMAVSERGLYFANPAADLTLSAQRAAAAAADPAVSARPHWARADQRFFWNRFAQQPLIDLGADAYVLPVMRGSVQQLTRMSLGGRPANLLLIVSRFVCVANTV